MSDWKTTVEQFMLTKMVGRINREKLADDLAKAFLSVYQQGQEDAAKEAGECHELNMEQLRGKLHTALAELGDERHRLRSLVSKEDGRTDEHATIYRVEHDGFEGVQIGSYVTLEGREGVVLQQIGTRVVHVYARVRVKALQ